MTNSRPPSLKSIAAEAGVSPMTVSLALRNSLRISAPTRTRIQEIAQRLGYQQNSFAASLVFLRTAKNPKYQATLACLNCFATRDGWRRHATFVNFYSGVTARAGELGYLVEEFWLYDPPVNLARLRKTLMSRGIPGIIVAFLDEGHRASEVLQKFDFSNFACVTLGWRLDNLNIHAASNDQFHTASLATRKLLDLGYRRIGLILNEEVDAGLEHRYRAGFLLHQLSLPPEDRVPVFDDMDLTRKKFHRWIDENRIDAVLSLPAGLHEWLLERGTAIPGDIGFAYLDRTPPGGDLAGIDQKSEVVGSAAVDIVVAHLQRNERGVPPQQKSLLIRGEWVDGASVRKVGTPAVRATPERLADDAVRLVKSAVDKVRS